MSPLEVGLWERVTPDAALLLPAGVDYDDPAVRAVRRKGIHGSDVAAIVGASTGRSAWTVWVAKHDGVEVEPEDDARERILWGNLHEPTVAAEWARRHGIDAELALVNVGTLVNVDDPWMRAQVDRLLLQCPDDPDDALDRVGHPTCALEVKCRSAWVASRWVDDVPDDVLAQVAWQRIVTGLDHIHVACLIDGNRLVEHRYDRDDTLEQMLVTECGALWDRVLSGDAPDVDYGADVARLLAKLFPDRAGQRELDDDEAAYLFGAWAAAATRKAEWQELNVAARGKVLEALGGHEVLTYGGKPVFTYKEVPAGCVKGYTRSAYRPLRGPQ